MSSDLRTKFRGSLKRPGRRGATDGCLIIGEVAQAHDGSLGLAHAFIDAIANAGADAAKFQTHIASAESTVGEPWRVQFSRQDASRYDYWKRMEFSEEQWLGLRQHCDERGLLFLSSPFSLEAVELLQRIGVPAWKVASGELSNAAMLDRMLKTGLPMIVSTGMASLSEVDRVVEQVAAAESALALLQCTTAYPCPPEKVGLNLLSLYRDRYGASIGLSDHSGTIYPGLAAVVLGAEVVEVHVTLSREMFGPDVAASITTGELKQLVEGIRFIERMIANPLDKDQVSDELTPLKKLFTKSVVARVEIPKGTVIRDDHLTAKKPGTGIPASRLPSLIGATALRDIHPDELFAEDDLQLRER